LLNAAPPPHVAGPAHLFDRVQKIFLKSLRGLPKTVVALFLADFSICHSAEKHR
jgi:hypothetical protein